MFAADTPRSKTQRAIGRGDRLFLGAGLALFAIVSATAAVAYAWPTEPAPLTETTIVGHVDDFEPGGVTPLSDLGLGAYLVRTLDGEFLAFEAAEPVNGCTLVWRAELRLFFDPCRGYEYDITGHPSLDNAVRVPLNRFDIDVDRHGVVRVTSPRSPQ